MNDECKFEAPLGKATPVCVVCGATDAALCPVVEDEQDEQDDDESEPND